MEEKITIIDKGIKLFLSAYQVLFSVTKTRLGSGFTGFVVSAGVAVFIWIYFIKDDISDLKIDVSSLKGENKDLKTSLNICETEKANVREIVRNELKDEVRAEYSEQMNVTFQYMQKAQEHLINGNVKKSKDIEQLEDEVQLLKKRKEAMK